MALLDQQQQMAPQPGLLSNNPALVLGMLMTGQNPAALATQMQQSQQQALQDAQKRSLDQQKYALELQKFQNDQQDKAENKQNMQKLADLTGERPHPLSETGYILNPDSKIVTGSGFLGGELTPQEYQLKAAQTIADMGQPAAAAQMIRQQGEFFQPTAGYQNGKPVYFQTDHMGNVKILDGLTPETAAVKQMASQDAQQMATLRNQSLVAQQAYDTAQKFENKLRETNPILFGPVAGKVAPYFNQNSQELQAYGNQMALLARTLYQLPASGFSDADRDFLKNAVANIEKNPSAALSLADQVKTMAQKAFARQQEAETLYQKQGNLIGFRANPSSSSSGQDPLGLR